MKLLLGARPRMVAALLVSSVVAGLTESGILAILAQAATALVDHASRVHLSLGSVKATETLGVVFAVGFALALLRLALQWVLAVVPARIAADTQARLRRDLFAAFSCASWGEQSRDREGHLQELLTNQVSWATQSVLQAATVVVAALTALVLVGSALVLNPVAAIAVLVAAVALFGLLRPLSNLGHRRGNVLSKSSLTYAGGVNETVRLAEETHVFGAARAQRDQTENMLVDLSRAYYDTQMLARLAPGVYQSLIYLLVLVALAGVYALGATHSAALGAVVLLLVRAGTYGQQVQGGYQNLRQYLPYIDRLEQAEHRYVTSSPARGDRPLERLHTVVFDDVSFAYEPGRPALTDVSFEVNGGEAIGVVGPSGAGKSTLVQILLGLRPPHSGRYLINGVPAHEFRRADWQRLVAYVPQEPRLLHGSVVDNIRFFRAIDDVAVEQAARMAGIHDDIVKWSAGYDTLIGPRADAISGGQQQRICIARALAADPAILVLDEPTSALDLEAEMVITESLYAIKHKLTLFLIAHRASTLDICDRVMVITDGRLDRFDPVPPQHSLERRP